MTTPALELETELIEDRVVGGRRITGFRIGHVSTREGPPDQVLETPKTRWSDSTVWKLRDGTYVLVRQSWSLVYHTDPTGCLTANGLQRGESATVGEMTAELKSTLGLGLEDAVSCDDCEPAYPEELAGDTVVRYEFVRRSIDRCAYPAQVIKKLTYARKYSGTVTTAVSGAVKVLLWQCRRNDPDWEAEILPLEQIG